MSRILLADDSPHAQRMGERILADEGFEVVTVSDGDSALIRLDDVDPDLVVADIIMPKRSGYEVCQYVKISPRHRHARVILTAGALDPVDEAEVKRVQADGLLRKPFEASLLLKTVKPLLAQAVSARPQGAPADGKPAAAAASLALPVVAVIEPEAVKAAVTVALDASLGRLVDELTERVLAALASKPDSRSS